jgi:predicted Zn-dependent peptidase
VLLAGPLAALAGPAAAQTKAPAITRTRLANGFTVLVRENPTAPVVAASLMIRMGTRWETRETAGISNFLQLMVVRGTATRSGTRIVEDADRIGGSIDSFADADYSEVAATALARFWREMLELVADVARNPTIPDGIAGPVRDFLLRQIRNRSDRPYDTGLDMLNARLFGPHGYGWGPLGLRESVERMDRNALLAHYRRHYVPGQMVLAVSGDVRASEVLAEAERLFGGMPPGPPVSPNPARPPALAASRDEAEVAGAQAQILMGGFGPALTDPDHAAVKVLATVLGGGMAGRFFSELRDKRGLAYTTTAQFASRVEPGMVLSQLGTGPENAARAEAALRSELERIQREPISTEELRVARAYLLGKLAMDRRTNARQAWYLAFYELAGVGYEFLDRYVARVRQITAADVQRVAQKYLATLRAVVVTPPPK